MNNKFLAKGHVWFFTELKKFSSKVIISKVGNFSTNNLRIANCLIASIEQQVLIRGSPSNRRSVEFLIDELFFITEQWEIKNIENV